MSASLPRIKILSQGGGKLKTTQSNKQLKLKFKKLTLNENQDTQKRKQSIKLLKSQRLQSLQRYSTVQQQRQFKNQKIYLNLIERKLLNGTYDEKKQTGNQLNNIKQKRDLIRVEMALKQKEIERYKALLDDVKLQISVYLQKKGQNQERLNQIKQKAQLQYAKTEHAQQSRAILQNMIKTKSEINLVLSKRYYDYKEEFSHLKNTTSLVDTQLRQTNQRTAIQQSKLDNLLKVSVKERQDRNAIISKHQEVINKRKEGQVMQTEKSKKYVQFLDEIEHRAELKDFKQYYDKILANIFITRYCKNKKFDLEQRYSKYEVLYNKASSYRSFDIQNPITFVTRFLEHKKQHQYLQTQISVKEKQISQAQRLNAELGKQLVARNNELLFSEQKLMESSKYEVVSKQRAKILEIKREGQQLQQKLIRIKSNILRMLKQLNQKGQKKIFNGVQATVSNLTLITTLLRSSFQKFI